MINCQANTDEDARNLPQAMGFSLEATQRHVGERRMS